MVVIVYIFFSMIISEPDDSIELEELNTNKRSITPPVGPSSHLTYAEDNIDKVRPLWV